MVFGDNDISKYSFVEMDRMDYMYVKKKFYFTFSKLHPTMMDYDLLAKYSRKYGCFIATYTKSENHGVVLRGIIKFNVPTTIYMAGCYLPGFNMGGVESIDKVLKHIKNQRNHIFYTEHPLTEVKVKLF